MEIGCEGLDWVTISPGAARHQSQEAGSPWGESSRLAGAENPTPHLPARARAGGDFQKAAKMAPVSGAHPAIHSFCVVLDDLRSTTCFATKTPCPRSWK